MPRSLGAEFIDNFRTMQFGPGSSANAVAARVSANWFHEFHKESPGDPLTGFVPKTLHKASRLVEEGAAATVTKFCWDRKCPGLTEEIMWVGTGQGRSQSTARPISARTPHTHGRPHAAVCLQPLQPQMWLLEGAVAPGPS